jgi:hypothetical protein
MAEREAARERLAQRNSGNAGLILKTTDLPKNFWKRDAAA